MLRVAYTLSVFDIAEDFLISEKGSGPATFDV